MLYLPFCFAGDALALENLFESVAIVLCVRDLHTNLAVLSARESIQLVKGNDPPSSFS